MPDPAVMLQGAIDEDVLELTTVPDAHQCRGGAHSRVADGRQLCWRPAARGSVAYAVDAEIAVQKVPRALGGRLEAGGTAAFWSRWTRAEVCAKLFDVPILVWITRHGLADQTLVRRGTREVHLTTTGVEDLVVTYGMRVPAP